jgi:hypothetical protein
MAVIIRPTFNASQIAKMIADKRLAIQNAILSRLQFAGEEFVVNARNTDTYHDQTGNLRSSIGYVVYHNGQLLSDNFQAVGARKRYGTSNHNAVQKKYGTGTKTDEGVMKARELADEVAAEHPQGFVLVCVAGMEYAASVEARGYDVITTSSISAVKDLKQAMRDLKSKINRL